jgi:RNA polymerase sigma factor (sigma-70 family)
MTRPASSFAIDVPDALLARMRRGETAAFEQVYRWFESPIYTLALRLCGDREHACDVLQETMLKVICRIADFRGNDAHGTISPFWGWLRQIAINESLMMLRRQRRDDGERLRTDNPDYDDAQALVDEVTPPPPAAADAARLQRALDALPPATRAVLWLYHAEGYTHDEIAALMQRTPSFSKSQLARGSLRLRALLEPGPQSQSDSRSDLHSALTEVTHG